MIATMRCGNCKGDHATVADVKACHGRHDQGAVMTEALERVTAEADPWQADPVWPASAKQIDYVLGLQGSKALPDAYTAKTKPQLQKMERHEVSGLITVLKALPNSDRPTSNANRKYTMPEGRYALQHDGVWRFFEVSKGKPDSRWDGYTFVKLLIGAPGAYRKEPMGKESAWKTLDIIERDPKQGMIDYGLQSGVCGKCASPLTDPESLAWGIGPVCRKKSGWF